LVIKKEVEIFLMIKSILNELKKDRKSTPKIEKNLPFKIRKNFGVTQKFFLLLVQLHTKKGEGILKIEKRIVF
jgi:hypothetical protein